MPKSQYDQRRDIVATDELGRPWLVATELKTGDPTGHIYPCRGEAEWKGFSDEEIPPQQYLRVPKNKWGQTQSDRLEIDFDRWRDDVSKANDAWRRLFHQIGQKVYKNAFNPEMHKTDEYLLDLTGPKPSPSVEAIDKMIAARKAKLSKRPVAA
jgi:hypothetical protein